MTAETGLPADMLTSDREKFRRVRVDVAQTGFFEGREFRTFVRFDLGSGSVLRMRFSCPVPFVIFDESITILTGEVDSTAYRDATNVGGTWTAAPVIGRNIMPTRPQPGGAYYQAQALLETGGTFTPGDEVGPPILIKTSNATAQQTSVPAGNSRERGLAAGTYYIALTAVSASKGCYYLDWEERP